MKTIKQFSIISNKMVSGIAIETVFRDHCKTLAEAKEVLKAYNEAAKLSPLNDKNLSFSSRIVLSLWNENSGVIIEINEIETDIFKDTQDTPKKGRA